MKTFGTVFDSMDTIAKAAAGKLQFRPAEDFGDISLSIQASGSHYCTPRVSGLPIDQYEDVEVGFLFKDHLSLPSKAGIGGFDHLFEEGMSSPVAGYVNRADLDALRAAIRARGEKGATDVL